MALSFKNSVCNISFEKRGVVYGRENKIVSAMMNSIKSVEVVHQANISGTCTVKLTPSLSDAFEILQSGLLGTGISLDRQVPSNNSSGRTPASVESPTSAPSSEKSLNDVFSYFIVSFEWVGDKDNGIDARSLEYKFPLAQPSLVLSNTDIEITIQGTTTEAVFLAKESRFVFNAGTTALQAITNILAGDETSAESLVVNYDGAADEVKEALNKSIVFRPYIGNRLDIVKQILSEAGLYAVFPPHGDIPAASNALIIKGGDSEKTKIRKRFILFRNFDVNSPVTEYPIVNLSVEADTKALFVTGRAFGNQRIPFYSDTKQVSAPETSGGTSGSLTSTNSGPATSDPGDSIHGTAEISIARNAQENNHAIQDKQVDSSKDGYVKMNITTPGVYDLFVGQTVEVIVGDNLPAISGSGFVTKVSHFWDGDWITTFDFSRQAGLGDAVNKINSKVDASLSKGRSPTTILA